MWIDFLIGIAAGALTTALLLHLTRPPARRLRVNGEEVAWLNDLDEDAYAGA